ncbi:hypothetical protein E4N62_44455 [Streptomyces sp. MNU76]|uniref:hypothetical protein n=1 Tax=Streptomyces sp. MNU76 TaxID=2560026 RepID=UPI001E573DF0|nr:hypothetical protein [Streptomyces sp. MNU76]MCC9711650.1 hypothetical protein [Streptomyces sp. MNU76]
MQQDKKALTPMENMFSQADSSAPAGTAFPDASANVTAPPAFCSERTTPTDRASQPRQWSVYLTAARRSGVQRRTVASADVARIEEVTTETATQTLRFCTHVGLFTGGRGKFVVTDAGWSIAQLWPEEETHARLQLQALFLPHWSAEKTWKALRGGPMPVDELAKYLQHGLPGKPRRGVYLVEWLALALLVHRDRQNLVWPAPALSGVPGSENAECPAPAPESEQPEPEPELELDTLMGMTNSTLRELPPERYRAVLDSLAQVLELTPA